MKKLKASIIIPMYNAENKIQELIEALSKQKEKGFEVIIVDDGSTDNSVVVLKKIRINFPLKLIKQKNSGPAVARNKGAKNAKADIIIFLDSDCVPKEDFVKKIIEPFKDREIVGVQGEYETKNKEFLTARYVGYEMHYRHEPMKKMERIDHIATYACAYRKKEFGEGFLSIFKKANMEDVEFSYRLAEKNKKMVFQPEAIVKHPHPQKFWKFMKQQVSRGYWRVPGYSEHPKKILRDSYLGYGPIIQGSLSLIFIASLLLALIGFFINPYFLIAPIVFFALIYATNLPFGLYCIIYEFKMLFIAPLIASLRSIAGTIGFVYGVLYFKILKRRVFK